MDKFRRVINIGSQAQMLRKEDFILHLVHGKNGFAERFKILAGYRSGK